MGISTRFYSYSLSATTRSGSPHDASHLTSDIKRLFYGRKDKKFQFGSRKHKRCLVISEEKPQGLFPQFLPCLITAWCTLSHCPPKQSMHALRSLLENTEMAKIEHRIEWKG